MKSNRASYADLHTPRPLSEWHEDMGDVMWWFFPVTEAPYIGSPLDLGRMEFIPLHDVDGKRIGGMRVNVGGWPGCHTHFTPLPDYEDISSTYAFRDWGKK